MYGGRGTGVGTWTGTWGKGQGAWDIGHGTWGKEQGQGQGSICMWTKTMTVLRISLHLASTRATGCDVTTRHVDKNNHGPSYIIALGEYQGDRL